MGAAPSIRVVHALGVGGVACVLAAAWLLVGGAGTGEVRTRPPVRACLVDASASVVRRRPRWLSWARRRLRAEALAAGGAGEELAVIVFAADVSLRFGPGPPGELVARLEARGGRPLEPGAEDDRASRLGAALEVAEGLVLAPDRPPGRVRLLGDGTSTGPDPDAVLARLAGAGVRLERVEPPPPDLLDASVVALRLPPRAELGAPLSAVARIRVAAGSAGPPAGLALLATLETSSGSRPFALEIPRERLAGAPGAAVELDLAIELGPAEFGRSVLEVTVVCGAAVDPIPENDRSSASVVVEGELVLGAVARPADLPLLREWLAPAGSTAVPGIQVVPTPVDDLAGVIDDLDLLVTYDVSPGDLPAPLIEPFVRRGGGWLALGGWGLLADWSPGHSAAGLHALLPLGPAPTDQGPRDVVLLVDGSGSMQGGPFERVRSAAREMVAAALESDEISLRFFTRSLGAPHLIRARRGPGAARPASREAAARALLAAHVPGGTTWILSSLLQLATARERVDREGLVLLLSDGRERGTNVDPLGRAREIRERLRGAQTRLRVIAVGDDPEGVEFLSLLVEPGEEVVRVRDLGDLEAIFQREVNRARVTEGDPGLEARVRPVEPGSLAAEVLGPPTPGALPVLLRLVKNVPRPGAEILWESRDGEPLLGVWRVGSGRTALFSSVPRPSWAPAWGAKAAPFGPLLRWLGRGQRTPAPALRLDGGLLLLEGLGPGWPPILPVELFDPKAPDGPRPGLSLVVPPARPGGDPLGSRATEVPPGVLAPAAGRTIVCLLDVPPGTGLPPGRLGLGLRVPRHEEFRPSRLLGPAWFQGGIPPPDGGGVTGPGRGAVHPAGPWILLAGLAALFGTGLLRRLAPRGGPSGQGFAPRGR